jgi:uncharacterized membrane protein
VREDRTDGKPDGKGPGHAAFPARQTSALTPVLEKNIDALCRRRAKEAAAASWETRLVGAITGFAGSMLFVYLHLAALAVWIGANQGWIPGLPAGDKSLAVLGMVASVEAIFLATFVLIAQNRMAAAAAQRADLDLQISLLAEHEITQLATLASAIAQKLGVRSEADEEIEEIKRDVAPDAVLDEIETRTD